jgi:hypothetical protein
MFSPLPDVQKSACFFTAGRSDAKTPDRTQAKQPQNLGNKLPVWLRYLR